MNGQGIVGRYAHYVGRYLVDSLSVLGAGAKRSNRVLVVRPDGIGDFVVWLDSARLLRSHYGGYRVALIANRLFADLAECTGYFDDVMAVDTRLFEWDLRYRFRVTRAIRRVGAKVAIQPVLSRNFWVGDAMMRASGAPERIGAEGDFSNMRPWQHRVSRRFYTRRINALERTRSEFVRNAEFLVGTGVKDVQPAVARIGAVADLSPVLRPEGDYFVLFPGAGSPKRSWGADSFAEVARLVAAKTGWRPVVCGSQADMEAARIIIDKPETEGAISLAGRTSVPELVEVVRGARLLLGNETSAIHIAAAVDTPSVCLLGGGHFGRFMPYPDNLLDRAPVGIYREMPCYGCDWQCTQPHALGGPAPCISAITVPDVIAGVERVLSENQANTIGTH